MTLVVHAYGAYASYANADIPWRQDDYNVNKLVKALKGKEFKGHADIRGADGQSRRITHQNPQAALHLFSTWAATRLRDLQSRRVVLVPVPSSLCTAFGQPTTPMRMATSIQALIGRPCRVGPWLRFKQVMTKSSEGGTRNTLTLRHALVASDDVVDCEVVLVDDVKTTGAHLKACAKVLRENGASVSIALVAATTVWAPAPRPWVLDPEDIEATRGLDSLSDFL
jgi:hypothetical protein